MASQRLTNEQHIVLLSRGALFSGGANAYSWRSEVQTRSLLKCELPAWLNLKAGAVMTLQNATGEAAAEQAVDPAALQAAAATAQWVDTTAATSSSAVPAAGITDDVGDLAVAELAAQRQQQPEPAVQPTQQPFSDDNSAPPFQQTPMALAPSQQQSLTPGTEYHTPGAGAGETPEPAAAPEGHTDREAAVAAVVPGPLGHVVSLGASWLKRGASSLASDTTGVHVSRAAKTEASGSGHGHIYCIQPMPHDLAFRHTSFGNMQDLPCRSISILSQHVDNTLLGRCRQDHWAAAVGGC